MSTRLIIDGNAVYEIDEDCRVCGQNKEKEKPAVKSGKDESEEERKEGKEKR